MPWNNQGGGPWKPGNQGPWGAGPSAGPPDLEELLRKAQERVRNLLPSGGSFGASGLAVLALAGVLVWALSGFYTVGPNEIGVNTRFGAYTGKTTPGLNYNYPFPIGGVEKLKVTDRNAIDIGSDIREDLRRPGLQTAADRPEESLMLTGDENIADIKFRVIWQIDPVAPENFAFNVRNPQETVKAVAESAMRETVGRTQLLRLLTVDRKKAEPEVQDAMQRILNGYRAGVLILQVQLLSVDPPAQVVSSFRDVTAAGQDQQRQANEAQAYANKVVPEARGAAAQIVQQSEGYREQTVAEARGQASRFSQVYDQYKNAPDVTRERIYLETMERVFAGMDKVIVDQPSGTGVVPYLPLGDLAKRPGAAK